MIRACILFFLIGVKFSSIFAQNPPLDSEHFPYNQGLKLPYSIRENQLNKKNLIKNNSFEIAYKSQKNDSWNLQNWTLIGKNVKLMDRVNDTVVTTTDKKKCICIKRDKVNETNSEAEGVLSDFIEVIPGNYTFTYHTKLKKIRSNVWRLTPKVFEAIQIRINFFDKNKKPISNNIYYPYFETELDNSNKGYSFSNFWTIPFFDWGKVVARTYNYPFSEGDIPENCKYVRIFLGLKGSGTMWIDDVDFRYSSWNFTRKERVLKYQKDTIYNAKLISPTPKYYSNSTEINFYNSFDDGLLPEIVIPENPQTATIAAANLLKETIDHLIIKLNPKSKAKVRIIPDNEFDIANSTQKLIFSIGKNKIYHLNKSAIALTQIDSHEQGYMVKRIKNGNDIVFLIGNNSIGDFYAATSAIQLFSQNSFTYFHTDIVDYPDFLHRSFSFNPSDSDLLLENDSLMISTLSKNKMNRAYLIFSMKDKYHWKNLDRNVEYKKSLNKTGKFCKQSGTVDLAATIHPYYHFDYEMQSETLPDSLRYYWTHGNPIHVQELNNVVSAVLEAGANDIMLCSDDLVPHEGDLRKNYCLFTPEDKKQFITLGNAQAFMVNSVYKIVKNHNSQNVLEFCPPFYLNEFINMTQGKAEQYFAELMPQIPTDVSIVWTGNTVRSLTYDMADIQYFKNIIGRYPILFDNTLYARELEGVYGGYPAYYPEKATMCSLFEPYDLLLPDSFYKYNDKASIYINGSAQSEIYKIKYASVADYLWNNNDYNPDLSLWRTLYRNFGKSNALLLLNFDYDYFQLLGFIKMADVYPNLLIDFNVGDKIGENIVNTLTELEKSIKPMNIRLYNELKDKSNYIIEKYKQFKIDNSKSKTINGLKQI